MGKKPNGLPPELSAMLAEYREAKHMPAAAKDRVLARLHEEDRTVVRATPWRLALVGAAAAGLLLWGASSLRDVLGSNPEDAVGTQVPMQPTAHDGNDSAPTRRPTADPSTTRHSPNPVPTLAPTPTPTPPPPPPPEPPTHRREHRAPPPGSASQLGAENTLITRTWELVRMEQYTEAKATLDAHAKSFPSGVLAPERRALEVIVDCLSNPDSATGKASAYTESGGTVLLAKVRSACDGSE